MSAKRTGAALSEETLRKGEAIERIGQRAVRRAQEESRRQGVPNVYSIDGVLHWELPSGELSPTDPYGKSAATDPNLMS